MCAQSSDCQMYHAPENEPVAMCVCMYAVVPMMESNVVRVLTKKGFSNRPLSVSDTWMHMLIR